MTYLADMRISRDHSDALGPGAPIRPLVNLDLLGWTRLGRLLLGSDVSDRRPTASLWAFGSRLAQLGPGAFVLLQEATLSLERLFRLADPILRLFP